MARKFRQVNEAFDWVFEPRSKKEQVDRLKEVASVNQTIVPFVRWGVGAEQPDWGVPEGEPDRTKIEDDIPDGMGETTLTLEFRRIKQFTDPNANIKNLPPWKQEMNWMNILEGVHHKEAQFITAVKDQELIRLYPKLEGILKDLGITDYVKPKKKSYKAKDSSKKMDDLKAKVDFTK
jgi:hypothetical protein